MQRMWNIVLICENIDLRLWLWLHKKPSKLCAWLDKSQKVLSSFLLSDLLGSPPISPLHHSGQSVLGTTKTWASYPTYQCNSWVGGVSNHLLLCTWLWSRRKWSKRQASHLHCGYMEQRDSEKILGENDRWEWVLNGKNVNQSFKDQGHNNTPCD